MFLSACAAADLTDHLSRLGRGGLQELHRYLIDNYQPTSITGEMLAHVMAECGERYLKEVES